MSKLGSIIIDGKSIGVSDTVKSPEELYQKLLSKNYKTTLEEVNQQIQSANINFNKPRTEEISLDSIGALANQYALGLNKGVLQAGEQASEFLPWFMPETKEKVKIGLEDWISNIESSQKESQQKYNFGDLSPLPELSQQNREKPKTKTGKVVQGIESLARQLYGTAKQFTTPESIGQIASVAPAGPLGFATMYGQGMAQGALQGSEDVTQGITSGDPIQAGSGAADLLVNAFMGLMIGKGVKGSIPKSIPKTSFLGKLLNDPKALDLFKNRPSAEFKAQPSAGTQIGEPFRVSPTETLYEKLPEGVSQQASQTPLPEVPISTEPLIKGIPILEKLLKEKQEVPQISAENKSKKTTNQKEVYLNKLLEKQTVETEQSPTQVQNVRSHPQLLLESERATPELKKAINENADSFVYDVALDKDARNFADRLVKEDINKANQFVLDPKETGKNMVATAHKLIDKYSAEGNTEMALKLTKEVSRKLTESGQTTQAASMWNRFSPTGILKYVQDIAETSSEKNPLLKEKADIEVKKLKDEITKVNLDTIDKILNELEVPEKIDSVTGSRGFKTLTPEEQLARNVLKRTKEPRVLSAEELANKEMVQTLSKWANEILPKKGILPQKDPMLLIKQALTDRRTYQETWNKAKDIITEKTGEIPEQIQGFFDQSPHAPFTEGQLNSFFKNFFKEENTSLNELVRRHYSETDLLKESLASKLKNKYGLDERTAQEVQNFFNKKLTDETTAKKQSILNQYFKKRIFKKTPNVDRIVELSNLGAFSDNAYYDAVAEKFNLAHLDEASAAKLVELATDLQLKRTEFETNGKSGYGAAKVALDNYVGKLKEKYTKKSFLNPFIQKGIGGKVDAVGSDLKTSFQFIADNSRSIVASLDNSLWLRQGLRVLLDPRTTGIWFKNFAKSWSDIGSIIRGKIFKGGSIKDIFMSNDANVVGDAIIDGVKANAYERPNYQRYEGKVGQGDRGTRLDIGTGEESFPTSAPSKIPVLGRLFRGSEVAYEAGAMRLRMDIADKVYQMAEKTGADMTNNKVIGDLNEIVNGMTGRGKWGKGSEGTQRTINSVFFSVKFLKSNLDYLTMPFRSGERISMPARKLAATNLLYTVAATGIILKLAQALNPNDNRDIFDPRSSNFGKIRNGNMTIDVTHGAGGIVVLASKILSQESKSSTTGVVKELNKGYGSQTGMDVLWSFTENKFSPLFGVMRDLIKQETFGGKKPTVGTEVASLITPISIQNLIQSKDETATKALIGNIADGLGLNVGFWKPETDWGENTGKAITEFRGEIGEEKFKKANDKFNKEYNNWLIQMRSNDSFQKETNEMKQKKITDKREEIKKEVFEEYNPKSKRGKPEKTPTY